MAVLLLHEQIPPELLEILVIYIWSRFFPLQLNRNTVFYTTKAIWRTSFFNFSVISFNIFNASLVPSHTCYVVLVKLFYSLWPNSIIFRMKTIIVITLEEYCEDGWLNTCKTFRKTFCTKYALNKCLLYSPKLDQHMGNLHSLPPFLRHQFTSL